ncbi:MAG TPA: hypothetical protein VG939_08285 [Caulobacteraceae bacterium]|nr:hypothetical protein [Caulobacteraceae bacterium]
MRFVLLGAATAAFVAAATAAAAFQVGDRVEAWNIDWYPGVIAQVGSGNYAGYYLIAWNSGTQQWVKAANVRAAAGGGSAGVASVARASAPRSGRYVCMGYNGGAGMFRWYLAIDGGRYQQQTPTLAPGAYAYDAASRTLVFTSGPYQANWVGQFSVEREGRTHKIVLRLKAGGGQYSNIYCTNSTDS